MSTALPYLQKLRKSDLTELAETSNLKDFSALRKTDLEAALDEHLRANQTTYHGDPSLSDYYKRLGPSSPKKSTALVKSDGPEKKVSRKKKSEEGPTSDAETSIANKVTSIVKTPSRTSLGLPARVPLPPSPAAVTDAIDRQTVKLRRRVSGLYSDSGIHETSETFRDLLSSPFAIGAIALIIDAFILRQKILVSKKVATVPSIPYLTTQDTLVYLPDLFQLLEKTFWAPFTLWITTSLLFPLLAAYFVNLPLKAITTNSHGTRRSQQLAAANQFDPLVYSIVKALAAYVVYAQHHTPLGLFKDDTIKAVNDNVLGGWAGTVTSAVLIGTISIYEAILRKQ